MPMVSDDLGETWSHAAASGHHALLNISNPGARAPVGFHPHRRQHRSCGLTTSFFSVNSPSNAAPDRPLACARQSTAIGKATFFLTAQRSAARMSTRACGAAPAYQANKTIVCSPVATRRQRRTWSKPHAFGARTPPISSVAAVGPSLIGSLLLAMKRIWKTAEFA